jgi:hypothetical protein
MLAQESDAKTDKNRPKDELQKSRERLNKLEVK